MRLDRGATCDAFLRFKAVGRDKLSGMPERCRFGVNLRSRKQVLPRLCTAAPRSEAAPPNQPSQPSRVPHPVLLHNHGTTVMLKFTRENRRTHPAKLIVPSCIPMPERARLPPRADVAVSGRLTASGNRRGLATQRRIAFDSAPRRRSRGEFALRLMVRMPRSRRLQTAATGRQEPPSVWMRRSGERH